jgi:ribonuclease HI
VSLPPKVQEMLDRLKRKGDTASGTGGVEVAPPREGGGGSPGGDTAKGVRAPTPAVDWLQVAAVYADGGVIGRNPSPLGGTWAFCYVNAIGGRLYGTGGSITPAEAGLPAVTNNLTELLAVVLALECLPWGWEGRVYSDSQVTLRRLRRPAKTKWAGVPQWLKGRVFAAVARLGVVAYHLLAGHPTAGELRNGKRHDGTPVSAHNCWCDSRCSEEAVRFRSALSSGVPS